MTVTLKIFGCKYNQKGDDIDETWFKGDIAKCKVISKTIHKGYTEMANFLDKHKQKFKDRVMFARGKGLYSRANKVVFDGINTWVENRGTI